MHGYLTGRADDSHERELAELAAAAARLNVDIARLNETDIAAPSLLPGWSRGHLLTHLARATESIGRLVDWAQTGIEQAQYASTAARAADIEAGAHRSPRELAEDVRSTADRLDQQFRALTTDGWAARVQTRTGAGLPALPDWV